MYKSFLYLCKSYLYSKVVCGFPQDPLRAYGNTLNEHESHESTQIEVRALSLQVFHSCSFVRFVFAIQLAGFIEDNRRFFLKSLGVLKKSSNFAPWKIICKRRKHMSPVFRRENGYKFKIFSNEEERMHIHVIRAEKEAKFWLEPNVELAENDGFANHELNKIQKMVEQYGDQFKEQFSQHIGKRIND